MGGRGHGLTEKGIISCDNHRRTQTADNKLGAENNNSSSSNREENFSKAQAGWGYNLTRCCRVCTCADAESVVYMKGSSAAAVLTHPDCGLALHGDTETGKQGSKMYRCLAPVEGKKGSQFLSHLLKCSLITRS